MSRKRRNSFMTRTVAIGHVCCAHNRCGPGNVCRSRGLGCVSQMEPIMINLKVLSAAAALALALPLAIPDVGYAQGGPPGMAGGGRGGGGGGGGGRPAGGGGGFRAGGGGGGA